MADKLKIALYWGAACGGCDVAVLDLNEKILDVGAAADILLWPVATDGKYKDIEALPDGTIDACFFNGGVRNAETEHIAKLLRRKSKAMVAVGACAMLGGVPGLANQFGREEILDTVYRTAVGVDNPSGEPPQERTEMKEGSIEIPAFFDRVFPLDEVVPVDYYLPGCPPTPEWIWKAVQAIVENKLPAKGSVIGETKTLCDECTRERSDKRYIKKMYRPHEIIPDSKKCLLEQGILCMGPATRAGCRTTCINANMPCRGCYGAPPGVEDQGAKMLSAVCSLIASDDEKEIESILADVRDPMGLFYQFALPKSILRGRVK